MGLLLSLFGRKPPAPTEILEQLIDSVARRHDARLARLAATWTEINTASEFWTTIVTSADGTRLTAVGQGSGIFSLRGE